MIQSRLKLIGLTGNSGSGKSLVSDIFRKYGAYIIDADVVARQVVEPGRAAYSEIVERFGECVLHEDGTLNRRFLGELIYKDEVKRQDLIGITHKYIKQEIFSQVRLVNEEPWRYKCIVIDAPLLVEAGMHKEVDSVWVVYADYDVRLKRIMVRDSISEARAAERLAVQMPYEELKNYADVVITNNGEEPGLLEEQVLCFMRSN